MRKALEGKCCQRIPFLAKAPFRGELRTFPHEHKLREFVTRGPAPRDAPKGVPRGGAKRSPESLLLGSGRIRMGPGAVTA